MLQRVAPLLFWLNFSVPNITTQNRETGKNDSRLLRDMDMLMTETKAVMQEMARQISQDDEDDLQDVVSKLRRQKLGEIKTLLARIKIMQQRYLWIRWQHPASSDALSKLQVSRMLL